VGWIVHRMLRLNCSHLNFAHRKPSFSPKSLRLVLEADTFVIVREVVTKCIVQAVIACRESIGIYRDLLKKHPRFAVKLLEEIQESRSKYCCTTSPGIYGNAAHQFGGTRYDFRVLKERGDRERNYAQED
jgi:hypothetical protein